MIRIALYIFSFFGLLHSPILATAQTGLIINEIMANPNGGGLPPHEYLELYNNSSETVQLSAYNLVVGTNNIQLPTYTLSPRQYVLLCNDIAAVTFYSYGNVIALSQWYALNNSAATLKLIRNSQVHDSVSYNDTWYRNSTKRRGGWSLERINPHISCNTSANWTASTNPMGGTPARANSVFNTELPDIKVAEFAVQNNRLRLAFNVPLDLLDFTEALFELSPDQLRTNEIEVNDEGLLDLYFSQNISQNTPYNLTIKNVRWCGHKVDMDDTPIFVQNELKYNDVVINEILFNPKPGGVDFVELFNQSNYPINLQGWTLGNRLITAQMLILHPQQHLALSTSSATLLQHYPPHEQQQLHEMISLPTYPNQQGNVLLYARTLLMDSLYYNADMHSSLLKNVKGISLERQSAEKPSNQVGNFRSASTMSGGGTPGYKNSSDWKNIHNNITIFLTSKTMSPDGDSFEDYLEINYELDRPNYMLNIDIYSERGILINRLIRQQSAGLSGKVSWDGKAENGGHCKPGIYICNVEIYDDMGHRVFKKEPFVLTYLHANP